jgi:hypothetical protein
MICFVPGCGIVRLSDALLFRSVCFEVDLHTVKKCVDQANKVSSSMLETLEKCLVSEQVDLFARLNEKDSDLYWMVRG